MSPGPRVVRVLPDVAAIDREFDYLVDPSAAVAVGTMVRVRLGGRRVAGWVTAIDVDPPEGVTLQAVSRISGLGPDPAIVDLCRWAAWRWAGRRSTFMGTASPPTMVASLPRSPASARPTALGAAGPFDDLVAEALARPRAVLRLPPAADHLRVAELAAEHGDALVVCPSVATAAAVATRLRRAGRPVALVPRDWARAAAGGCTVVGARAAAFAPAPRLGSVVVLDEHDEAHQNEGSPTWHAREVALERARRARVPALLVSPCPTLEAQMRSPVVAPSRAAERAGWPVVQLVDRRDDDLGRTGLYAEATVAAARAAMDRDGPVVFVLNRTGRAALLACRRCGELTRCDRCQGPMAQFDGGDGVETLLCRRCGHTRVKVCQACGWTALRMLRLGVSRVREELEALLDRPVLELTGASTDGAAIDEAEVVVGTEAALHRVRRAALVVFLEFDQELMAPRYRAAEQAMALLARAGRLVGGREQGGRIVVQHRQAVGDVAVLSAAERADPAAFSAAEEATRRLLRLPPYSITASVGGAGAAAFMERLAEVEGISRREVDDGWLLEAEDRRLLLDALAATPRPPGRLRLQVDPLRA